MTFKSHIINRYEHIVFFQMLRNGRNTDPNLEILKDKIKITPNLKGVNYNLNLKLNTWWAMAVCFDNKKKKYCKLYKILSNQNNLERVYLQGSNPLHGN